MKHTFWVGWEVDDEIPLAHMVEAWPAGMKGWCSGYGEDFGVFTGRVDADTAEEAEAIVRGCYGASGKKIRMRWEPQPHEFGWRPNGGRFPE